ncbi:hypothetical protein [Priestia megaterium]|uniref:hypothetical protein n=1 Tax=Priestia megaterium TaxID=1404 RepID=UPI003CC626E4
MPFPIFSSKIVAGVLAGSTFTLGAAGLLWAGGGTIEGTKQVLVDTKDKIFNYEANENTLLGKITAVKKSADEAIQKANGLISSKNAAIADLDTKNGDLTNANGELTKSKEELEAAKKTLEADKEALTGKNGELEASIVDLNSQLSEQIESLKNTQAELEANKDALTTKEGEYKALQSELSVKIADLEKAQGNIQTLSAQVAELTNQKDALAADKAKLQKENGELKETISWGTNKVKDIDKNVKGVEGEITKANKDAEGLQVKTDEFKSETNDTKPLTEEEINAVDTNVTEVQDNAAQPETQQ